MAIESISSVVATLVKESVGATVLSAGKELALKMGQQMTENLRPANNQRELQSMEQLTQMNQFRLGENNSPELNNRDLLKQRELNAGDELREKFGEDNTNSDDILNKGNDIQENKESDTNKEKENCLTSEEKENIKQETGWSDDVVDHISSMDEYEILKNANLEEVKINGRTCLVKKDLDLDYVDPKTGKTNEERMVEGRSPIDAKTGEKIELHHLGQDKDGPLVELRENSEHGDGNHGTLHSKEGESWRNEPGARGQYDRERADHWKTRAEGEH